MSAENRIVGLVGVEQLLNLAAGGDPPGAVRNSPESAYVAGDLIADRYRLVRLIGRGGMGVVWEAHSEALDIRVAIKLIHPALSSQEDHSRLIREAKAVARLADPAVIRVFDCGETLTGQPYVVMELLEGQDLATRLDERGRMSPIETVRTLLPIVRALGTAHAANIVHRDVKPENVFLTRSVTGEEQPKLLDFGIARFVLPCEKRLTQLGSAVGSPAYMSPEQARGEDVDHRADLWAVCVVLYEAIAGELPFDGNGYNAIMYSILSAPMKSFSDLAIDEPELWAIVARGLERDCSLRWQSSADLVGALSRWLISRGVLHDVAGVSVHATQNRLDRVATLRSVRPVGTAEQGATTRRAANAALTASTTSDLTLSRTTPGESTTRRLPWNRRTRWVAVVLSSLALGAVGRVVWYQMPSLRAVPRGTTPPVAAPATFAAPRVTPVVVAPQSVAPSTQPVASVTASSQPASAPLKPSYKKQPSASKGEPFKNPFE